MDTINHAINQISDLFRSMTPAARITTALLLAVVVVSVGYLFQFHEASLDDYLLAGHAFSQSEMTAALAALSEAGLREYEVKGAQLLIPRGQRDKYVAALVTGNALPVDFDDYLKDVTDSSNPLESSDSRRSKLRLGERRRMGRIIGEIKGIEKATVAIDETETTGLRRQPKARAAVYVKPEGSAPLTEELAYSIQLFVAGHKNGMSPDDVTVMDQNTGHSFGGPGEGGVSAARRDPYAERKRSYEQDWRVKIEKLLVDIPGVRVQTNVTLDPFVQNDDKSIKYDSKNVAELRRNEVKKTEKSGPSENGGQPGADPNGVTGSANRAASLAAGSNQERSVTESDEQIDQVPSQEHSVKSRAPLVPMKVSVSVSIPRDYYRQVWVQQKTAADGKPPTDPPPANELAEIETKQINIVQSQVIGILPSKPLGEDKYEPVSVKTIDTLPPLPIEEPGIGEQATTWLGSNWGGLAMVGLGIFALMMLRGIAGSTPESPTPVGDVASTLSVVRADDESEEGDTSDGSAASARARRRFAANEPSIRDELAVLVKEDPDTAVAILKNWIGEAS